MPCDYLLARGGVAPNVRKKKKNQRINLGCADLFTFFLICEKSFQGGSGSRVMGGGGVGGWGRDLGRDGRLTLPNAPEAAHFTAALIEN